MRIQNSLIKRILDNASIEFGGIHDRNGHGFMAVFRIEHHKITFNVNSKNPRKATLEKLLFEEFARRVREIDYQFDVSWSNYCRGPYLYDPYSLMPLVEKYLNNQYLDLPHKSKAS